VTPSLRRGVFWLLVSELCYAVMRVATRAGAADLPWAEIAAARFLGGAVVAVVAARARGVSLRVGDRKNAWLRSIFGTAAAVCLFHALGTRHIAVGDATVLYGTTPLWVALLSGPLLRERVGPLTWGGIGVGFAGVAVLLQAGVEWRSPTALLVLLGAFSYALALLRLRRMSGRESSESIALHLSLVAGAVHLAIALPAMRPVRSPAASRRSPSGAPTRTPPRRASLRSRTPACCSRTCSRPCSSTACRRWRRSRARRSSSRAGCWFRACCACRRA
jgi:drug/metabolite transporter (DMT)-like permease